MQENSQIKYHFTTWYRYIKIIPQQETAPELVKIENMPINCFKTNKVFYMIYFGVATYISLLINDLKRGLFTISFVVIFSYLSHMVGHKLYPINLFHKVHHNDEINHTFLGKALKWIVNFLQIAGLLLIPMNRLLEKKQV